MSRGGGYRNPYDSRYNTYISNNANNQAANDNSRQNIESDPTKYQNPYRVSIPPPVTSQQPSTPNKPNTLNRTPPSNDSPITVKQENEYHFDQPSLTNTRHQTNSASVGSTPRFSFSNLRTHEPPSNNNNPPTNSDRRPTNDNMYKDSSRNSLTPSNISKTNHLTGNHTIDNPSKSHSDQNSHLPSSSTRDNNIINWNEFDVNSIFETNVTAPANQHPSHTVPSRVDSNDTNPRRNPPRQQVTSESHYNRPEPSPSKNENKRIKPNPTATNLAASKSVNTDSTNELSEDKIKSLLHEAIASNDTILMTKYFNMLQQVKTTKVASPQPSIKEPPKPKPKPTLGNPTSVTEDQSDSSQANQLKKALDEIWEKQKSLDLLKTKVKQLSEEIEHDRKKFLSLFHTALPGGLNFAFPFDNTKNTPSGDSSVASPRQVARKSVSRSPSRSTRSEPPKTNPMTKVPENPAPSTPQERSIRIPRKPSSNNTQSGNLGFKGFASSLTLDPESIIDFNHFNASNHPNPPNPQPAYYKASRQNRKCRSLILGNMKKPFSQRKDDVAITTCMNGIVTIYTGPDYSKATEVNLKDVDYRWAEDICFLQPDLVAVLSYSDSNNHSPTPLSLMDISPLSAREPSAPILTPLVNNSFTKPLTCITPIYTNQPTIDFLTGGMDHRITLWRTDRPSNNPRASPRFDTFPVKVAHSSTVHTMAFDHNMKWLHSGGADCKYFITDLTSEKEIFSAKYQYRINEIVNHPYIPQLQVVSFAATNLQFQLIDNRMASHKTITSFGFEATRLLSKYIKHTINHRGNLVACADPGSNDILIWDLRYNKVDTEFFRLKAHDKKINCVNFSPFSDSLLFTDEATQLGIVNFTI